MDKPNVFNYLDYKAALRQIDRLELRHANDLEEIKTLRMGLTACRNELCERCGRYKKAHLGACEGCRWRD